MRHDKEKIFDLRKSGNSYREIQVLTGISRATLSKWFENVEWSIHLKHKNIKSQSAINPDVMERLKYGRQLSLKKKYENSESDAKIEFELHNKNPLFIAGLMVYAGEGDKLSKGLIRVANTDFYLHKIFINFITTYLKVDISRIKCGILIYPDLDMEVCRNKWSQELGISICNFYKPYVIKGKHKTRKLHYGIGSTIISSTFLKKKLLIWIELTKYMLVQFK